MLETKQRTLFYRRVGWFNDQANMEALLKQAHVELPNTEDRTFDHGEGQIQGMSIVQGSTGLLIHVGYCIPKQAASLIPIPSKVKMEDTTEQPPPAKHNFLQGDIFFLVSGNNLILCPSGLHEHTAIAYIKEVFEKTKRDFLLKEFSIDPVAHVDKLKLLHAEGVKRVQLNTSIYAATHHHMERKSLKENMISGIKNVLGEFIIDPDNAASVKDMENLSVKMEINFDGRKKGGEISKKKLESLAKSSIDEQGFTIITRNGKKMSFDEIRLSEKVNLPVEGSSVVKQAAWNEIEGYFKRLKNTGMIEQ